MLGLKYQRGFARQWQVFLYRKTRPLDYILISKLCYVCIHVGANVHQWDNPHSPESQFTIQSVGKSE